MNVIALVLVALSVAALGPPLTSQAQESRPVQTERAAPATAATSPARRAGATLPATIPATIPTGVTVHTAAVDPTPTRVTLRLQNAPADAIFRALCEQAGAEFRTQHEGMWASGAPTIDAIDVRDELFWNAVHEVCQRSGTRVGDDFSYGQFRDALTINNGRSTAPAAVDGPLLFRVTSIERHASILYGAPRTAETVIVSVQVRTEPRLRPHAMVGRIHIEQAVDEGGMSLRPTRPSLFSHAIPLLMGPSLSVPLELGAGAGQRITTLRGRAELYVPRRVTTVKFMDPLAAKGPVAVPVNGATLTMKLSPRMGGDVNVELELARGEGMDQEIWADMAAFHNMSSRVALVGPQGPTGSSNSSSSFGGAKASTRIRFTPSESNPPDHLQVEFRTDFQTIPTTFEFKDLPLP